MDCEMDIKRDRLGSILTSMWPNTIHEFIDQGLGILQSSLSPLPLALPLPISISLVVISFA